IRFNHDTAANSHPHIWTGLNINMFSVPADAARELITSIVKRRFLTLVAVHVHVGSQITAVDPLRNAAMFIAELARDLRQSGTTLEYVDLGGGLGISYDGKPTVSVAEYVAALVDAVR